MSSRDSTAASTRASESTRLLAYGGTYDIGRSYDANGNLAQLTYPDGAIVAFAAVFIWWGIEFVRFGWNQSSELAELPMPFIFVAWPLAGATWLLFLAESFFDNFRILAGREVG